MENRFHGLLGIPTSFSPKENLAISFPEITEGCIQPTIQTVHLTLHTIIYFPSPLNFFQAPDNRIQALHCDPCRDRSCRRKKKNKTQNWASSYNPVSYHILNSAVIFPPPPPKAWGCVTEKQCHVKGCIALYCLSTSSVHVMGYSLKEYTSNVNKEKLTFSI